MFVSENEEYEKIWQDVKTVMPSDSRILITGANGLIASNIVDTLMYFNWRYDLNNQVWALCRNYEKAKKRFASYIDSSQFGIVAQDITQLDIADGCEYIIHAASNAHPLAYSTKPIETMETNLIGTMKVLEYACDKKVKQMVYVSTSEVYGEGHQNSKLKEEEFGSVNTLNPRSCYAESKRCAETLCVCYAKMNDLDVKVVRPGYIYGAQITSENSRADAQFLRNAIERKNIIMKSLGQQRRSYCYVADAVSAILLVLFKGEKVAAYNIANKESEATIAEYAKALADARKIKVIFEVPDEVEKAGYSQVKNSLLDDSKLRDLGWTPHYDLKSGVNQMFYNIDDKSGK